MNSKLYVRNLSDSVTENDLRTLCAQSGTVVMVDIIKDRVTGPSKGYADKRENLYKCLQEMKL